MAAAMIGLVSCKEDTTYVDGSYKSEEAVFDYGWKYFMEVSIADDEITVVTFDAYNEEDNTLMKSEDPDYQMPIIQPSEWVPMIETQYMAVDLKSYSAVDGVTGATIGSEAAEALFELILDAALDGDKTTQILPVE